jgi:SNF family Na+-dependent transporter
MNEKIMSDILQLISIFFFLAFSLAGLSIVVGLCIQVIRWITTNWKTLKEANWLGVFMILGIILLFMCYGPIIIF